MSYLRYGSAVLAASFTSFIGFSLNDSKERYQNNDLKQPNEWIHTWDQAPALEMPHPQVKCCYKLIILVRHGQYDIKAEKSQNKVLTELGWKQAKAAGKRLRELGYKYDTGPSNNRRRSLGTRSRALVVLPYIGAIVGTFVNANNMDWYNSLRRPPHTPPSWVFGPVWTVLYGAMGVASALVLRAAHLKEDAYVPLAVYLCQLLLNWSWTPVFFGLHKIRPAVPIILGTTVGAASAAYLFARVNVLAGYLMLPYVFWLIYASTLNIGFAMLNQEDTKTK